LEVEEQGRAEPGFESFAGHVAGIPVAAPFRPQPIELHVLAVEGLVGEGQGEAPLGLGQLLVLHHPGDHLAGPEHEGLLAEAGPLVVEDPAGAVDQVGVEGEFTAVWHGESSGERAGEVHPDVGYCAQGARGVAAG